MCVDCEGNTIRTITLYNKQYGRGQDYHISDGGRTNAD